MRSFSFIAAFVCFLIGPSLVGAPDRERIGIGTFSYNGSPVIADALPAMVVAAR